MSHFEKRISAREEDIDELGHVNNAAWVRWIQDVATEHWNAAAPPEHRDALSGSLSATRSTICVPLGPAKR